MIIVLRKTRYGKKGIGTGVNGMKSLEEILRHSLFVTNSLWTAFGNMVISFVGMSEHDPKEIISDFWKLISSSLNPDKTDK